MPSEAKGTYRNCSDVVERTLRGSLVADARKAKARIGAGNLRGHHEVLRLAISPVGDERSLLILQRERLPGGLFGLAYFFTAAECSMARIAVSRGHTARRICERFPV